MQITLRNICRCICILFIGILCIVPAEGFSESENVFLQRGDYFYERYEFRKAIVYYDKAYKKEPENSVILLKKAEAYSKINQNKQAEECYRMAVGSGEVLNDDYLLKYALLLFKNKKFEEARRWLEEYNKTVENDIRGQRYLSSIENQETYYKDSTVQIVENLTLLNTRDSEINPVKYNNTLYFASSRANSIDATKSGYYDIYKIDNVLSDEFKISSLHSAINSELHEGPMTISNDGLEIYFTRNIPTQNKHQNVRLGIYKSKLPSNSGEKLELQQVLIQNFNHSIGHPTVSSDGNTLIFISNPTTGIGGLDIYQSTREQEVWSYPVLLSSQINTKGDEMFPFLFNDSILYFASDGLGGIGGLDIYSVNLKDNNSIPVNLGYPINSQFDDFGLFLDKNGYTGYFCSNRPGGLGSDDIYKLDLLKFKVKGALFDVATQAILEEASMKLLLSNGEEFSIPETENGEFEFSIVPGESYTLVIEKEDYIAEEIVLETEVSAKQKELLIGLQPFSKTEIALEPGVKYDFTSGNDSIDSDYIQHIDKMAASSKAINTNKQLAVLAKQMRLEEGDIYSLQLIKAKNGNVAGEEKRATQMYFTNDTVSLESDSVFLILPVENESNFSIKTDVEHLADTRSLEEVALNIDKSPILTEEDKIIFDDEAAALRDLEFLMSLSINTTETDVTDSLVHAVTAEGFSIIPQTEYKILVGRLTMGGVVKDQMELKLSKGIKYDFSSDPSSSHDFSQLLSNLIDDRDGIDASSGAVDIAMLSKELKIQEGEEISFSLLPTNDKKGITSTIKLSDREFDIASDEKFVINIPYTPDKKVNLQTDIRYLKENFAPESYSLSVDTFEFFSEIEIDTIGYYSRFGSEKKVTIDGEEQEALAALEYLMSLSINTERAQEDTTSNAITTEGFSILPQTSYTLKVGKMDSEGNTTDEMKILLTPGVKYDFSSDSKAGQGYRQKLNSILTEREGIVINPDESIDISLLSKELEIGEGEEIAFSILPEEEQEGVSSTIYLTDREFNIAGNESFVINVPYTPERTVNIQTNLDYIQQNYKPEEYSLAIDTVTFFSEIWIDTTGLSSRYKTDRVVTSSKDQQEAIAELEYLMSLSINAEKGEDVKESTHITSEGFSVLPQTGYKLKVGKIDAQGNTTNEMEIPLTPGVKYDFSSDPGAGLGYRQKLNYILSDRKNMDFNTDKRIDISLLSKELEINEGEEIAFSLMPDETAEGVTSKLYLDNRELTISSDETFVINVPHTPEGKVNIQTDLDYIQQNYKPEEYSLAIDTVTFFSEIWIDTTGLSSRYKTDRVVTMNKDQQEAIAELEYLMSLSINSENAEGDSGSKNITSEGFSILPQTEYTLKVGRLNTQGIATDEMEISLTPGVKYSFGTDPGANEGYRQKLNYILADRKNIEIDTEKSIDISLLSKELNISEGEEIAFSLMPKESKEGITSTLFLTDREVNITDKEKFVINVPYTPEGKVNIQTDLDYIQQNYKPEEYSLAIDTVTFFSEIWIDTTGLSSRYKTDRVVTMNKDQQEAINELEYLMSLSINSESATDNPKSKNIISEGFSILPQTNYTLKVGKLDKQGNTTDEMEIPLTPGVKYDFSSNRGAALGYRQKLNYVMADRENLDINTDEAIDISLLSKELEIEEGEEIAFSLLPEEGKEGQTSTIFLASEKFEITNDESFVINVPYTPYRKVNIQTNLEYLQDNFEPEMFTLSIDTVDFFSEITIDTSGLSSRFKPIDDDIGLTPDLTANIEYRVQIVASRKPLSQVELRKKYSGYLDIRMFEEENWYKYYIADAPTYFEAKQVLNKCGVKGAFVVAYNEGEKITLREAMSIQYKERQKQSGFAVTDSIVAIVTVNFEFDKFSLREDEESYLQELVIAKMKEYPHTYAAVNGHTDERGTSVYNMGLANERAVFVRDFIVSQGIDSTRVNTFSFGESQVLKACDLPSDCDESVHEVNRRVEIILFAPTQ